MSSLKMVFFVPAGSPPAVGHSLRAMLHTPYCWFDLALPAPVGGSQSRLFCVVADGWRKLVELSIQDACVKHSLAQKLGKDPAALRLQFTVPLVSDAVVQGYTCRGVLAVADSTTPSSHDLALVDCRPLLQGWHLFSFQDGRYSHAELTAELELFAPSQYHVQLEGAELDDDALLLVPGQVLTALFVPSSPAPSVEEAESSDPTDDEPSADGSADDQDGHSRILRLRLPSQTENTCLGRMPAPIMAVVVPGVGPRDRAHRRLPQTSLTLVAWHPAPFSCPFWLRPRS